MEQSSENSGGKGVTMRVGNVLVGLVAALAILCLMQQSAVARDRKTFRFGSPLVVERDEVLEQAVVIGANLTVRGEVEGDAVVVGGSVILEEGATVGGDMVVVGSSATLEANSLVEGDTVIVGGTLTKDESAIIEGEVVQVEGLLSEAMIQRFTGMHEGISRRHQMSRSALFFLRSFFFIVRALVWLALGALLIAFIPERMDAISSTLQGNLWKSGLVGLLAFIGIVPLICFVAVTIIGIPLIPVILIAVVVTWMLGHIGLALTIGNKVGLGIAKGSPYGNLLVGVGILALIGLIPYLGDVAILIAWIFGWGAVLFSRYGSFRFAPIQNATRDALDIPIPPPEV